MSGESDRQVIGSPLQAGVCRSTAPVHGARYCRGIIIVKGYRDHAGIAAKARCKARRSSLGCEGSQIPVRAKKSQLTGPPASAPIGWCRASDVFSHRVANCRQSYGGGERSSSLRRSSSFVRTSGGIPCVMKAWEILPHLKWGTGIGSVCSGRQKRRFKRSGVSVNGAFGRKTCAAVA